MNRFIRSIHISSLKLTMLLAVLLTIVGCANTNKLSEDGGGLAKEKILKVMDAYQPERPSFMSMNAGYLKIQSLSDKDIYIVSVSSPDYQSVSIHNSIQVDGMHEMESVSSLKIPATKEISLEPGGMHLMLHMPVEHRKAGDFTTIIFTLDDGSNVTFKLAVRAS
ncbi:MAG: copper(I)-binding protein [Oleiphilaceae bacterium]